MRIAVCYNRDIYALKVLNLLLPALQAHEVLLLHSSRVGAAKANEPRALTELHRVEQQLLADISSLQGAAVPSSFSALAERYGHEDWQFHHVNEAQGLEALGGFAPDLLLSIRFGKILRDPAIAIPAKGVINLHSGLLPAYRGVMPTFRALLAGDRRIGTTLHWISDASIDTGATISTARIDVDRTRSYLRHVWQLYDAGVAQILAAVQAVECGELLQPTATMPSHEAMGSYYSFPNQAAMDTFSQRGLLLFTAHDLDELRDQFRRGELTAN